MAEVEENPLCGLNNAEGEDITEKNIQYVEQDPNFHKCLENIFEKMGKIPPYTS